MAQMSVFLLFSVQICFVQACMGSPRKLQTEYFTEAVTWEDYWTRKLPSTPPPREMASLASSLSALDVTTLAKRLQVGQGNTGVNDSPFCRNYGFLCGGDVHGPLVCVGPYWYEYAGDRTKCQKESHDMPVSTPYHVFRNDTSFRAAKNTTTFHEAKNATTFHEAKNNTVFHQNRNVKIFHEFKNDAEHNISSLFFRPTYLVEGSELIFPKLDNNLQGRSFLPASLATMMPLDTNRLERYLKIYEVPEDSNMATSMNYTLSFCNSLDKEVRKCHTSVESMVDFVVQEMGSNVVPIVPSYSPSHNIEAKVMAAPTALSSTKSTSITCHDLMFPFLVYGCHVIPNSIVYNVVLQQPSKDSPSFHAPYVCHMDTKSWDASHKAFSELQAHPGDGTICHWVPQNNIIWTSV